MGQDGDPAHIPHAVYGLLNRGRDEVIPLRPGLLSGQLRDVERQQLAAPGAVAQHLHLRAWNHQEILPVGVLLRDLGDGVVVRDGRKSYPSALYASAISTADVLPSERVVWECRFPVYQFPSCANGFPCIRCVPFPLVLAEDAYLISAIARSSSPDSCHCERQRSNLYLFVD